MDPHDHFGSVLFDIDDHVNVRSPEKRGPSKECPDAYTIRQGNVRGRVGATAPFFGRFVVFVAIGVMSCLLFFGTNSARTIPHFSVGPEADGVLCRADGSRR